jgi:hypothetical protein
VGALTAAAHKLFGLDDVTTGIALDCIRIRQYIASTQARKKVYDSLDLKVADSGIYSYQVRDTMPSRQHPLTHFLFGSVCPPYGGCVVCVCDGLSLVTLSCWQPL